MTRLMRQRSRLLQKPGSGRLKTGLACASRGCRRRLVLSRALTGRQSTWTLTLLAFCSAFGPTTLEPPPASKTIILSRLGRSAGHLSWPPNCTLLGRAGIMSEPQLNLTQFSMAIATLTRPFNPCLDLSQEDSTVTQPFFNVARPLFDPGLTMLEP